MTNTTPPRLDPEQAAQAAADFVRAWSTYREAMRPAVQQMLATYGQAANAMRAALAATEPAREDGHTGACDATEHTGDPRAADEPNGPQTGAQDRETYRAAFQHLLPESAWHLAGHLADAAAGLADQWTRALEQRNSRLRGELRQARAEVGQLRAKLRGALAGAGELREQRARLEAELRLARADLDHRDQTIRHLENGLRHERDIVDRVRAVAKNYPGLTALRNALADHATPGEVLPDELLRLLDMNRYVSTACDTAGACETAAGDHTDNADQLTERAAQLHARCRRTHKFTGQPCGCDCHHQTHP